MVTDQGTILIVDDNAINLTLLIESLNQKTEFELLSADSGEGALDILRDNQPDIILLDIMMPGIDGFETCRRVKANSATADIPIIFMTALSETSDKVKGFRVGAVDYITKPIQHEELIARINTHMTIRNLQKQLKVANDDLEGRVNIRTSELAVANSEMAQINADLKSEIEKRHRAYENLNNVNLAYSRFVPKALLKLLNQRSIVAVQLGDHRQMDMTIMFSDIRSFTTISEKMSPQENFNFINAYFRRVSPIIRQYHGFVDKYIGDAIMALFPTTADDAIQASITMLQTLSAYNETRNRPDRMPINIGVGLHTGGVMLGTVGENERMEGTVISDAVNLAARLEGLTGLYGASMIVSEKTLFSTTHPESYNYRFLDTVQVKGKTQVVPVFEILDGNSPQVIEAKLKTRSDFEQALSFYQSGAFRDAIENFEKVLAEDPHDKAAALYIKRATQYIKHGVPENWSGANALNEK